MPYNKNAQHIKDIMDEQLMWIQEEDRLDIVLILFTRCDLESAPVRNTAGKPVGVIDRTCFFHIDDMNLILGNGSLDKVQAKDFMKPIEPYLIDQKATIEAAAKQVSQGQLQSVLVKDHKEDIIGTVSIYDLLEYVHCDTDNSSRSNAPSRISPEAQRFFRKKLKKDTVNSSR